MIDEGEPGTSSLGTVLQLVATFIRESREKKNRKGLEQEDLGGIMTTTSSLIGL